VLSGEATATPKSHDGPVECLRVLKIVQRSATKNRTQSLNQLRNLIATAPDELRGKLRGLKTAELLATCAAFRVAADDDSLAGITRLALRELAQRVGRLQEQLHRIVVRLQRITRATAPELIATHGVGPDTASTLLLSAGDNPHRLASESSWAALLGPTPIPASSGKTHRHRLNRGGDRQANAALWRIAVVRMRSHPDTRATSTRRAKKATASPKRSATSSATSPASSTPSCHRKPWLDSRSPRLTVGASLMDGWTAGYTRR